MPSLQLSAPGGYCVRIDSTNRATLEAWLDEWLPWFCVGAYPAVIGIRGPLHRDPVRGTDPDWPLDVRASRDWTICPSAGTAPTGAAVLAALDAEAARIVEEIKEHGRAGYGKGHLL